MAELVSTATGYSTQYDTLIPQYTDPADIREAFIAYHFGVSGFNSGNTPAANSIHGFMTSFQNQINQLSASAVVTLFGTANEVTVSASTGYVTVGLPDDVTIGDDLTVTGDLSVGANSVLTGNLTVTGESVLTKGLNIFGNTTARDSSITSPVEGILTYISSNDQFMVYNGTSWVGIENHGTLSAKIDEAQVLALLGL